MFRRQSALSETAFLRAFISIPSLESHAEPREAWLSISACLRWKYISKGDESEPAVISPFRNANHLSFCRLPVGTVWCGVEQSVRKFMADEGTTLIVPGFLTTGNHRELFVDISILIEDKVVMDCLADTIRSLVSPWHLLYERTKSFLLESPEVACISKSDVLCSLFESDSEAGDDVEYVNYIEAPSDSDDDEIDRLDVVSITKLVESSTSIMERAGILKHDEGKLSCASDVRRTASMLGVMTLAYPLIHYLVKTAWEVKRGGRFLHRFRGKVEVLHRVVVRCMISAVELNELVDDLPVRDYFESQEALVVALERMEMQVMGKRVGQFWKKIDWDMLESAVERFHKSAVSVSQAADVYKQLAIGVPRYWNGSDQRSVSRVLRTLADYEQHDGLENERVLNECVSVARLPVGESDHTFAVSEIALELGILYKSRGMYDYAEPLLRECIGKRRFLFGDGVVHVCLIEAACTLAELFKNRESRKEAISLYWEVLDMRRRLYVKEGDHVDIASTQYELATLLEEEGDLDSADVLLRDCLGMRNRLQEVANIFDMLATTRSLARVACKRGQLELSESLCRLCLSFLEDIYGQGIDDFEKAEAIFALGAVLDRRGTNDEAEVSYRESVSMMRRLLGAGNENMDLAYFVQRLGIFLTNHGEVLEAENLCRESLAMYRRLNGGDNHVTVTRSLCFLADAIRKTGKKSEAEELYCECLEKEFKMLEDEEDGTDLIGTLDKLAKLLLETDRLDEAEQLYRERLLLVRLGNEDCSENQLSPAIWKLAGVVLRSGDLDEAEQLCRECLDIDRRGNAHSDVSVCLSNIAEILEEKGCLDEAEALYQENLELVLSLLCEVFTQNDHAIALRRVASILRKKKKLGEAEERYRECLEIERRLCADGDEDVEIITTLEVLGQVLVENSSLVEAREIIVEGLERKRLLHGDGVDHLDVAWSFHELARVATRQNQMKQAEELLTESLEMKHRLIGDEVDDEDVSVTMENLAGVMLKRGRFAEAERMLLDSLDMRQRMYGDDFNRSGHLVSLGEDLLQASALEAADRVVSESLEVALGVHGEDVDHGDVAYSLRVLGTVKLANGFMEEAEKLITGGFDMYARLASKDPGQDDHSSTMLYWRGVLAAEKGMVLEAKRFLEESVAIDRRCVEKDTDEDLRISLYRLGEVAIADNDVNESEKMLLESMAMGRRLLGEDAVDRWIAYALLELSYVFLARNSLVKADESCRRSRTMFQQLHDTAVDHLGIARSLHLSALLNFKRGLVRDAVLEGENCLAMYQRIYKANPKHHRIIQVRDDIEEWSSSQG